VKGRKLPPAAWKMLVIAVSDPEHTLATIELRRHAVVTFICITVL